MIDTLINSFNNLTLIMIDTLINLFKSFKLIAINTMTETFIDDNDIDAIIFDVMAYMLY